MAEQTSTLGHPHGMTGDKVETRTELKRNAQATLDSAKQVVADTATEAQHMVVEKAHDLVERGRRAYNATDVYVHENPWKAAAMGGLIGLAIGLLIRRH